MNKDACDTIHIEVIIQGNGIIRGAVDGKIYGRLGGGVGFKDIPSHPTPPVDLEGKIKKIREIVRQTRNKCGVGFDAPDKERMFFDVELAQALAPLMADNQPYKTLLKDTADDDTAIRKEALKVLPEFDVEGDSFGVPTVVDIVESLVKMADKREEWDETKAFQIVAHLCKSTEGVWDEADKIRYAPAMTIVETLTKTFKPPTQDAEVITRKQFTKLLKYLSDENRSGTFRYLIYDVMGFEDKDYSWLYSTGLQGFKDLIYDERQKKSQDAEGVLREFREEFKEQIQGKDDWLFVEAHEIEAFLKQHLTTTQDECEECGASVKENRRHWVKCKNHPNKLTPQDAGIREVYKRYKQFDKEMSHHYDSGLVSMWIAIKNYCER